MIDHNYKEYEVGNVVEYHRLAEMKGYYAEITSVNGKTFTLRIISSDEEKVLLEDGVHENFRGVSMNETVLTTLGFKYKAETSTWSRGTINLISNNYAYGGPLQISRIEQRGYRFFTLKESISGVLYVHELQNICRSFNISMNDVSQLLK